MTTTIPQAAAEHSEPDIQPRTESRDIQLSEDLQLYADQLQADQDLELATPIADQGTSLAIWYMKKLTEMESVEAMIRQQSQTMLKQIETRRKALQWRWGNEFKAIIDSKLNSQGGKKKSIDLPTGRAGYRAKQASAKVFDEKVVVRWAEINCPEALEKRVARTTPIVEWIEQNPDEETGEIKPVPGVQYTPSVDSFYPSIGRPALEVIRTPVITGDSK